MRYAVGILACVAFYLTTVVTAFVVATNSWWIIPLSGLVGAAAGTTVLSIGLGAKLSH